MPRPRFSAEDTDRIRQRLQQQAFDLYLQDGLEGVTLRKLAQVAGLSHTYVYRYYPSKTDLLVALRTRCSEEFISYLMARDDAEQAPDLRVRAMVESVAEFATHNRASYQLLFTDDQPSPDQFPELHALRQSLVDHVAEMVARLPGQAAHGESPAQFAQLLWAAVHGVVSLHLAKQLVHGTRMEELLDLMLDKLLVAQ